MVVLTTVGRLGAPALATLLGDEWAPAPRRRHGLTKCRVEPVVWWEGKQERLRDRD